MWLVQKVKAVGTWDEDLGESVGERLRGIINIGTCQFGFMAGKSTTDAYAGKVYGEEVVSCFCGSGKCVQQNSEKNN